MIKLFEHNRIAYEAAIKQIAYAGKACVIHPTGTGKSFIAFKWVEDNPDGRFVWLSPSENIYNTQLENVKRIYGFVPHNVTFISFERLMLMSDEEIAQLNPTHTVIDEFHRAGATQWEINVRTLMGFFPAMKLLGLSATPIRYLDNRRDMADELFDNCIADQMGLGEAVVRGILPAPKYIISLYAYENELENYRTRLQRVSAASRKRAEEYMEQLRRALEKAEGLNRVFAKHMTRGKYLVFCANRDHLNDMVSKVPLWFGDVDPQPHVYSVWSDSSSAKADYAAFKDDDSDHLRLLYCIDMFNEGVHVDGLDGVILFRPTISPIIYKQQIGRALSASRNGTPVIFDIVNNFDNLYSISSIQAEMRQIISFYRNNHREDEIVADSFEIIDEVQDCRRLFANLEETLGLSWELMYQTAKQYYAQYGNLNVPSKFRTEDDIPLGAWIQTQRRVYNGKENGLLDPGRIALLNSIGMIWESRYTQAWEKGYNHAVVYHQEHGHLNVPATYVCDDGYKLGSWISNLRYQIKAKPEIYTSNIWQERRRMLEAMGLSWEINTSDEAFETGYQEAKRYYGEHGTLDVPSRYISETGFCLGKWIASIRRRYKGVGNGAPLTEGQIKKMDSIGMEWQGCLERQWERCFIEAEQYYLAHGDLHVPEGYVQNGVALWKWLVRQETSYRKGEMDPDKASRLESIGMKRKTRIKSWSENYELARQYYKTHGDLEIPPKYVAENGAWLGKWVLLQRTAREKGELTLDQIAHLDAIGMRWVSSSDMRWKEAYEAVNAYIESGYSTDSLPMDAKTNKGVSLSNWLKRQQQKERSGKLSAMQASMLKRLMSANQR